MWADGGARAHGQTPMKVVRIQDAAQEREGRRGAAAGFVKTGTNREEEIDFAQPYSGCSVIWGMRDDSSGSAQDVRVESAAADRQNIES